MATINKALAEDIAARKGQYPGDPTAFAVFEYKNAFDGELNYAVVYSEHDFHRYFIHDITRILYSEYVEIVDFGDFKVVVSK